MTLSAFLDRIVTEQRKTGRKPVRVDLSAEDVAELRAEIAAKPKPKRCCCPCHMHEVRQGRGHVMTIVGVEVYCV